ncbi:pyridoxine/pyridoxamine 5'-phosphate oxidase-like [Neocloeon triangulifer]|uniref:pyridoxine/pyridoxamine 5'-phosphate oxidase-like n=1 Tax=Neocloeon triangulifer TaxID=2078957 RepID=UPI00286F1F50|nr:pyridoxine/pyridoxamine 5'-phosphate oxidase-like [Neocloeon triangulifer]
MANLLKMNGHPNGHQHEVEESDLFKIEVTSDDPIEFFREWYQMAEDAGVILPQSLNLATSDGCGRVSARTLLMRRLVDDGFIIMTDKRSKKSFDIAKCPRVALTFLWMYPRQPKGIYAQQVRVEGLISEIPFDEHMDLYTTEPLYCKIRSNICRQGEIVEWSEHKEKHDRIYKECVEHGPPDFLNYPPEHYVMYKVKPEMMDFYMATDFTIGDRVVFRLSDQPNLIPATALKKSSIIEENNGHFKGEKNGLKDNNNGIDEMEKTFQNGLKIATGAGQKLADNVPKEWVHYRVSA